MFTTKFPEYYGKIKGSETVLRLVLFIVSGVLTMFCPKELQKLTSIRVNVYIPLTNRVRGPYRKLRTEFFPPRFMA